MSTDPEFKPVPAAKRLTLTNLPRLKDYGVEMYQIPGEFRLGLLGNMPEHCRWLYSGVYNTEGAIVWRHHRSNSCLLAGHEDSALRGQFKTRQVQIMLQTEASLAKDYANDMGMPLNMSEMVAAIRLIPITEIDRVLEIHNRLGLEQLHMLAHHPERWLQANPAYAGMPIDLVWRMHGFGNAAERLSQVMV